MAVRHRLRGAGSLQVPSRLGGLRPGARCGACELRFCARSHARADERGILPGTRRSGAAAVLRDIDVRLAVRSGTIGWQADAPHRAAALEPHLPAEWSTMKVENLRVGRDRIAATIAREPGVYSIQLR